MKIAQALRLPLLPRLAVVGAGGKTSLLFQAGRELLVGNPKYVRSVLVTTTTHLADWQVTLADQHILIDNIEQLAAWKDQIPSGLVVVTCAEESDHRLRGLDEEMMAKLLSMAEEQRLPLLIEADGARMRPLKAPKADEPAISEFARQVVVCAGMSGIGKPLNSEWVHRAERFSELSGMQSGQNVTAEALQRVLAHPEGGMKNIPEKARRMLLLTQAETPELQAEAAAIAEKLRPYYDSIVTCRGEPIRKGTERIYQLEALNVCEPVAGIVLAAGGASRFGQGKQLLDWGGKPFVRQVAETALQAGLSPVVVVVGAYAEEVSKGVEEIPVQIAANSAWEQGQATSVKCGIQALPGKTGAAVFLLCDQPQVPVQLLRSLVEMHQQTLAKIVAPMIDGQRGNPVLFDRDTFEYFTSLSQEQGGRALFSRFPVQWLSWHDSNLLIDVDTPEDYRRLVEIYQTGGV
jgi:molybdenum cofactor cytidylyltransferase